MNFSNCNSFTMKLKDVDIKELTEKYNKNRLNLPFMANQATENDVCSLLKMYPQFLEYNEDALIREIGWQLRLIFD